METENKEPILESPKKDTNPKKKKILYYFLNALCWSVLAFFILFSGCKMIDQKTGYKFLPNHSAVIISPSMSFVCTENLTYLDENVDHIYKNDVVHSKKIKSYEDVEKLDVILYVTEKNNLVCHRVVNKFEENGTQYLLTRGDANNIDDAPITFDQVRGKVTKVTKGGNAILFFQSPYFVFGLCGAGFFVLLGMLIYNIKTDKPEEKHEN